MALESSCVESIDQVDAQAWDALVDPDDPFCTHAFLKALEDSGSVGTQTSGWLPRHLLLVDNEKLAGAMPLYLKFHSYGEYIFDWGWAQGAQAAGLRYYPKLLSAVPFTPATGRRFLCDPSDPKPRRAQLSAAALALTHQLGASGLHVLFCQEAETTPLPQGLFARHTHQYHFHIHPDWRDFSDYLDSLRSRNRKQVRRERREAQNLGLRIEFKAGSELEEGDIAALRGCYHATIERKWAQAYLDPAFFSALSGSLAPICRVALAYQGERAVAAALFFTRGAHLYGRYWGALGHFPMLHFELCYYLPIEWAIAQGLTRFEAGAQGQHKIKRGFCPEKTYSLHALTHPGLADAVARYVAEEQREVQSDIDYLERFTPFKKG